MEPVGAGKYVTDAVAPLQRCVMSKDMRFLWARIDRTNGSLLGQGFARPKSCQFPAIPSSLNNRPLEELPIPGQDSATHERPGTRGA